MHGGGVQMTEAAVPNIGTRQKNAGPANEFLSPAEVTNPAWSQKRAYANAEARKRRSIK
jgi:hypothetical protein